MGKLGMLGSALLVSPQGAVFPLSTGSGPVHVWASLAVLGAFANPVSLSNKGFYSLPTLLFCALNFSRPQMREKICYLAGGGGRG